MITGRGVVVDGLPTAPAVLEFNFTFPGL